MIETSSEEITAHSHEAILDVTQCCATFQQHDACFRVKLSVYYICSKIYETMLSHTVNEKFENTDVSVYYICSKLYETMLSHILNEKYKNYMLSQIAVYNMTF